MGKKAHFNSEQIIEIEQLYIQGVPIKEIAFRYGCGYHCVYKYLKNIGLILSRPFTGKYTKLLTQEDLIQLRKNDIAIDTYDGRMSLGWTKEKAINTKKYKSPYQELSEIEKKILEKNDVNSTVYNFRINYLKWDKHKALHQPKNKINNKGIPLKNLFTADRS